MTDYKQGDTIYMAFTTRSFSTGVPTTLSGTPVVSAYEDASLTQITAGITLGVDHDSVTGLNMLTIVATTANGYDDGKDYAMVITTGTVGGVSVVGEVVGSFSLSRSAAAADLANGTDGLGAIKTDTAAILTDTGTTLDAALAVVDANVDAILLDTAEIGTAGAGLTDLGGMSTAMKAEVNAEADTAITDAALATAANLATVDTVVDGIQTDLDNATDGLGALKTLIDALPSAATINSEVDTAFTTIMADSVPADGTIPTREQALYMINQFLYERATSGTTVTVKKVDGSTALLTLTLDDATNPTSITRAT